MLTVSVCHFRYLQVILRSLINRSSCHEFRGFRFWIHFVYSSRQVSHRCLKPFDGLSPSASSYYDFNKYTKYTQGCLVVTENTSQLSFGGDKMNQYHRGLAYEPRGIHAAFLGNHLLFFPLDLQKVFPPLNTWNDVSFLFFPPDNSLRFQSPREQELSTLVLLPWRPPRRPLRWHQIAPAPLPALSPASLSSRALMVWRRTPEAFLEMKW